MQNNLIELKAASEQTYSCDFKSYTEDSHKRNDWDHDLSGIIHYPSPIRAEMMYLSRNSSENPPSNNEHITGNYLAFVLEWNLSVLLFGKIKFATWGYIQLAKHYKCLSKFKENIKYVLVYEVIVW